MFSIRPHVFALWPHVTVPETFRCLYCCSSQNWFYFNNQGGLTGILLNISEDNNRFTAASHTLKYKRGISKKLGTYPTWNMNMWLSGALNFKDWEFYLHQTVQTHPHHKILVLHYSSLPKTHNVHLHCLHTEDHQQHISTARENLGKLKGMVGFVAEVWQ